MTDAIESLERREREAKAVLNEARVEHGIALGRLNDALCAAKLAEFEAIGGIIGKTRVRVIRMGKTNMDKGPFLVAGAICRSGSEYPEYDLRAIKKDGTVSQGHAGVWFVTNVAILPEDQP